jgi:hypothetical protein
MNARTIKKHWKFYEQGYAYQGKIPRERLSDAWLKGEVVRTRRRRRVRRAVGGDGVALPLSGMRSPFWEADDGRPFYIVWRWGSFAQKHAQTERSPWMRRRRWGY